MDWQRLCVKLLPYTFYSIVFYRLIVFLLLCMHGASLPQRICRRERSCLSISVLPHFLSYPYIIAT